MIDVDAVQAAAAELATPLALAVTLPYAVALVAVAAEVLWLARRSDESRDRALGALSTASVMAAGSLVVGIVHAAVFQALWRAAASVRPEPMAAFWDRHALVGVLVAFVVWDASGWLYHAIGHRTRVGWAAHQPHHSGEAFDVTLGLRQTWTPVNGLLHQPLVAVAGFDLATIVVCAAVSNAWQVLQHSSAPVRLPRWLEAVFMTPRAHRHHHGVDGGAVNLGPVLTVWDRLAGTWRAPDAEPPRTYGSVRSGGAVSIELAGWRDLWEGRSARRAGPAF